MLQVTQINANQWKFTARKVKYFISKSGEFFDVWTQRGPQPTPPRVFTREELRRETKTLAAFLRILEA